MAERRRSRGGTLRQRIVQVRLELAAACGLDVRQTWQEHTANWRRRHPMWLHDRMHQALWDVSDPGAVVTRLVAIFGVEAAELVIGVAALGPPGRGDLAMALAGLPAPEPPWGSAWGSPWRLTGQVLWRRLEAALATRWAAPCDDIASASSRVEAACQMAAFRLGSPSILAMAQALDGGERAQRRRLAALLVEPPPTAPWGLLQ
jgi:hypothetical protein